MIYKNLSTLLMGNFSNAQVPNCITEFDKDASEFFDWQVDIESYGEDKLLELSIKYPFLLELCRSSARLWSDFESHARIIWCAKERASLKERWEAVCSVISLYDWFLSSHYHSPNLKSHNGVSEISSKVRKIIVERKRDLRKIKGKIERIDPFWFKRNEKRKEIKIYRAGTGLPRLSEAAWEELRIFTAEYRDLSQEIRDLESVTISARVSKLWANDRVRCIKKYFGTNLARKIVEAISYDCLALYPSRKIYLDRSETTLVSYLYRKSA